MRRIKSVFAVAAMAIMLVGSAAPAVAGVNLPNCFPFCDNNDHRHHDNFFRDDGRNLFGINDGRRFFDNRGRRFFINDGQGFGIGQGFSQESESGNANLVIR